MFATWRLVVSYDASDERESRKESLRLIMEEVRPTLLISGSDISLPKVTTS